MLPPFVPPGARAVAEPLPLITEFVLHRDEQATAGEGTAVMESSARAGVSSAGTLALPSITEFTVVAAAAPETTSAPVQTSGDASSAGGDWVEEERNAFDWQSVAGLAATPSEAQRAADEWDATDWDRPAASSSDLVARLLAQTARRVRAGELKVDGTHGMSPEAALASTLAALLQSEND